MKSPEKVTVTTGEQKTQNYLKLILRAVEMNFCANIFRHLILKLKDFSLS